MARGTIVTRTLEDGSKRYYAVIRINGKQKWRTFSKKKKAEEHLDRNSTDVRDGTYRELKKATFGAYVESWKAKELIPEKLKPATLNSYGSNIAKYLKPEFESCQLTAIDAEMISDFESKLLAGTAGTEPRKKQSPKSTRNILNLLNRILSDAKRDGYLRISPMTDLQLTKVPKEEARALTKDEVGKLIEQCQADVELRLVVLLGVLAGLRRNEIFALQWEDLDAVGNVLQIRRNLFWRHGKYQGKLAEDEPAWILHAPKTKFFRPGRGPFPNAQARVAGVLPEERTQNRLDLPDVKRRSDRSTQLL
jgi:integrase